MLKGNAMTTFTEMKKHHNETLPKLWDSVGTGYFSTYRGSPKERSSLVHLTIADKAICGAQFASDMMYSFCSMGVHMPYVECKHCKQIHAKETANA